MKLASRDGIGALEKTSFRWFRLRKRLRQFVKYRPGEDKTVVFIVGCQRSGTSMMHHLFRLDPDTVTYDELSPLSRGDLDEGLRLDPLPSVSARIAADRAPMVVCKPLVESQNLAELLELFSRTRAIWMYRDFRDVVISNLEYFGERTAHDDLQPIVADDRTNWRAEHLAPETTKLIRDLYRPQGAAEDAAALFWYARNSLYFSRGYASEDRISCCRYGELVSRPAAVMAAAYRFIDRTYPGDRIVADVFTGSRGRGRVVALSPDVEQLCTEMMGRLDEEPGLHR